MTDYAIADFDRFRFLRDSQENLVSLEAQAFNEQLFPILDLEYFRLARLHVHDAAAKRDDVLEAFEKEMAVLAKIDERVVSRPITWGRDDDELFYVNSLLDGEPLPDYLSREGARSQIVAAKWLLPFVNLIDGERENPMSILRFSNRNLQVVRNLETNEPELHFTEFTAWTKPGNLVVERGPEYFLAQSFCSLISGIPLRDFTTETLPRQFEYLSESCQEAVRNCFESEPGVARDGLFAAIRKLADWDLTDDAAAPPPRSALRGWIRRELEQLTEAEEHPELGDKAETEPDLSYASETEIKGLPGLIQFFPGKSTIPREGWLEQHWIPLRRHGRGFTNQLAVYTLQEYGALTLIGEEYPEGIHLRRLIRETGPLGLEHVIAMGNKISSALDGLEASSSATPVWWLPEKNVFFSLGTREASDFKRAIENEGPDFWGRVPVRLRLHQTMLGLLEGINLPRNLREKAIDMNKENPHIRRAVVLLPLIGMVLAGRKFQWEEEFELESGPGGLAGYLDQIRRQLIEAPDRLEMGWLKKLGDFVGVAPEEKVIPALETEETASGEEDGLPGEPVEDAPQGEAEKGTESGAENGDGSGEEIENEEEAEGDELREFLSHSLGQDTIDLNAVPRGLEEPEPEWFPAGPFQEPPGQVVPVEEEREKAPAPAPGIEEVAAEPGEASPARDEPRTREEFAPSRPGHGAAPNHIAAVTERNRQDRRAGRGTPPGGMPDEAEAAIAAKSTGLIWVGIILAGLLLGGGFGYYLHGKVKHAGLYEVENDMDFPETEYVPVSGEVNPFTRKWERKGPASPAPARIFAGEIGDLGTAIAKSKIAVKDQRYREGVDFALRALQLDPDSIEAGGQLEDAIGEWIEAGIDVPVSTSDPGAIGVLSEYYIRNNPSEGLYLLMSAARDGNTEAMRVLGVLFGQGQLVPRSASIAERWIRNAAEKGDQDAQFYYGESARFGTLFPSSDEGMTFVSMAADAGHVRSLLFWGYCHLEGEGVERDPVKGFRYVSRSAEKGSLDAVYQMGLCRASGLGIDVSRTAAALAFKDAAELGHVPAMYRFAQCLLSGFGTPQSYADGVSWMKKAAAAGHEEAEIWCETHGTSLESVAGP